MMNTGDQIPTEPMLEQQSAEIRQTIAALPDHPKNEEEFRQFASGLINALHMHATLMMKKIESVHSYKQVRKAAHAYYGELSEMKATIND